MALIKTVTRISPINMFTKEVFSKLSSPEHFGIPCKVEVCDVTNPKTGMQYRMETTYIMENIDSSNQDINKALKYGLVPAINNSLPANCESSGFYTLFVPKKISKSTVSSALGSKNKKRSDPKKGKANGDTKLCLSLNDTKHASKKTKNVKKNIVNEKLLQSLLNYFVDDECLICGFISLYESEESSIEHMKTHIRHNSLTCDCCNKAFSTAPELFEHKINRTKKKPYLCEVCSEKFKRNYFLTLHLQTEHASSLHPTHSKSKHSVHTVSTKSKDKYQQFPKSNSKTHSPKIMTQQMHTPNKNKTAEPVSRSSNCSQVVHDSNNIQPRLTPSSKSSKKQPQPVCSIACSICGKKFQSISSVMGHRRYHAGAERYKCLICTKKFSNSRILKYHEHILGVDKKHNQKEPRSHQSRKVLFSCNLCENKFYLQSKLLEHKKLVHNHFNS